MATKTTPAGSEPHRDICLIRPARTAPMRVSRPAGARGGGGLPDNGDVDLDDLRAKVGEHAERLSALMIAYRTHGVYEARHRRDLRCRATWAAR